MRVLVVGTAWTTEHNDIDSGRGTRTSAAPMSSASARQPRYFSWCTMRSAGGCKRKAERALAIEVDQRSHSPQVSAWLRPVRRRGAPQRVQSGFGGARSCERHRRQMRRAWSPAAMSRSHARQTGGSRRSSRPRASSRTRRGSHYSRGGAIAARIRLSGASICHQFWKAAAACCSSISWPSAAGRPSACARLTQAVRPGR